MLNKYRYYIKSVRSQTVCNLMTNNYKLNN